MDYNNIKNDYYIKDWLSGIGAKPNTKMIYCDDLRAYTSFLDMTPGDLILTAEEDIKTGKLMRERGIVRYLRDFKEFLEESGAAPMSVKGRLTGVRSFYKYYSIDLPVLPRSSTTARPQLKRRDIPTKEDIREVLAIADTMEKAIVLTGVASGLSVNEIVNLKIDDFLKGYDKDTEITTLHLIREKVGYEFYTFLTPEASRAVQEYIELRNRTSEKKDPVRQEQLLKQKFAYDSRGKPTGYLFIGRYISSDYLRLKDSKDQKDRIAAEELRGLSTKAVQKIYRELSERARKSSPSGDWNLIRSHGIRKFCYSALLANSAEKYFTDFIVGHQLDNVTDAYFKADPKALREKYIKFVPYLTIIGEAVNIADSIEWRDLKDENVKLKALAEKYFIDGLELINAKSEIRKLQIQLMPEEERDPERKKDIIKYILDMKPENESQRRFKEEMKKVLEL